MRKKAGKVVAKAWSARFWLRQCGATVAQASFEVNESAEHVLGLAALAAGVDGGAVSWVRGARS
jgi:hypothetical protein